MVLKASDLQCYLTQALVIGLVIIIFHMDNSEKLNNITKIT